jgi:exodeoxyribonuclease VII large subunit
VHCAQERERLHALGARLDAQGRRAVLDRARALAAMSRAPAAHVERHQLRLHQQLRELRASARRVLAEGDRAAVTRATVLARKAEASSLAVARRTQLEGLALALAAHDPDRTLERGYALVEGPDGQPVTSAAAARSLERMTLRMHDGTLPVEPA